MKNIFYLFLICLFLPAAPEYGQAKNYSLKTTSESFIEHDFKHFIDAGRGIFTSPARFSGGDWLYAGSAVLTTAAVSVFDKQVKLAALVANSEFADKLFKIDKFYGSGYTLVIPAGIYAAGLIVKDKKLRITGLKTFEALFYSGLITLVIKSAVGRTRPYAAENQYQFNPFSIDNDYNSFPSGHTTVAFAVSAVLAESVDNIYWKIFTYGAAGLVAGARIYNNQHWLSDVLMGAFIGYTVGKYVSGFDMDSDNGSKVSFKPYIGINNIGVNITF